MNTIQPRRADSFDWERAKRRLQQLAESLQQSEQLSAKQAQALMDQRARALAQVPDEAAKRGEVVEVLILLLAGERFAVETRFIQEVFHASAVTPVPGAPETLLGVTNLRGEVLAVMDFHRLLGLGQASLGEPTRLVVFGRQRAEFGVPGDEIAEVTTLRVADILEPENSLAGAVRDFARGLTQDGLIVLDGEIVMNDGRLVVDDSTG
jgi:purine-binding chemotaxis protein CheW